LYRVEGELVGFRKFTRDNVEINVNTTARVDIHLAVGELEESVIVTGEAPMLQTDRTDTGRIIESTQITQLPLAFNRNFQGALAIVPGAFPAVPPAFGVLQLAGQLTGILDLTERLIRFGGRFVIPNPRSPIPIP
jgi:hypothetical protein